MEDKYVCSLTEKSKKVALDELREDDYVREKSLQSMKEWISKSPHIKYCRTDALFLLRFLRARKFSVPLACEQLENYLTARQLYPRWFQKLDCDDKVLNEILDSGYIASLPEKHDGKTVVLSRLSKFDIIKHTADDMVKIHTFIFEALAEDEENQVNGYIYLCDNDNYQMAHLAAIPYKEVPTLLRCITTSFPARQKGYYFFNFSKIFIKVLEFASPVLSEKTKSRLMIYNTLEELKSKIDPNILPKEYGGQVSFNDMVDEFKKKVQERKYQLLALDDLNIEIDKNNKHLKAMEEELGIGTDGTFRNLKID